MKKIFFLLIFLNIASLFSQSGWQVVYPGSSSTGQYYEDIIFFDSQTGWILGNNNVTKTTNGGLSWNKQIIVHSFNQLTCFCFYSKDIGWVGENRYLNFTSNSGLNWSVINTTISNPRGLYFSDLLTGWVCGDSGMIKKTTDGGFNWASVPSGISVNLRAITFADGNTGICAGDWGTILSTTNGGANWRPFYDSYLGFFSHVRFKNSQTGFVTGTGGNIYRTSNSGANWSPYYVNSSFISGIHFLQNGYAYAFGSPGLVYRSTNSGATWEQRPANGLFSQVNAASITNEDKIWVAADSIIVYNSTDLGSTWSIIYREYLTKEHLNSVYFTDQFTGFACGEKGILLRSTNSGINWTVSNLGTSYSLKDIQFVNSQIGFIGGWGIYTNGVVFRTSNGGSHWQPVFNDSVQISSVHFIDANTGWAAGGSGYYIKTTNSGSSWIRSRFETVNLDEIYFINNNSGFTGNSSGLFRTTNSGSNWLQVSAYKIFSIQFIGNAGYVSAGNSGAFFILKSTNFGVNWTQYQIAGGQYPELSFANEQTGWIIVGNSLRKTTNGGANWVNQTSGINSVTGMGLYFHNSDYGWCVGMYGGILRTTTGGIGITNISTEIPQSFTLYQNYPNPFNPKTKIRFSIPKTPLSFWGRSGVELKIYDILGKEIAVLVSENLGPGTFEAEWDASDFSSGIYFYSLNYSKFKQTRKMVVLK